MINPIKSINPADLLTLKSKAMMNLVAFRYSLLSTDPSEVMPAEYHYEWSDTLLNGKRNTAIEGFRESAKTQYVLRSFLLYCLTFPSKARDYIVLIKNNATLAGAKLREIEREYNSNPILSANKIKVHEESAGVFAIDVKDVHGETICVRIEAYGKGASIRGLANIDRRPKCHVKGSLIWQDGRLVKVEDSKYLKGEVESDTLEIRVHGIPYKEKVSCEHRFWCRTKKKINNKWRFINTGEWKHAEDISVNDYIGTPIDNSQLSMAKISKNIPTITNRNDKGQVVNRGVGQKEIMPEYFNDSEFWWAIGLWWGDGHIAKNRVYWTCANKYPKIKERLEAVISRYSDSHCRTKANGCEILMWNNTSLSDWLKTWRFGNSIKIPPMWVRKLDNEKVKNIVQGYLDSDGWMDRDRKQARITSINYEGLLILSEMIARLGIASYVRLGAGPREETFPNGHISLSKQKYDLMMSNGSELFGMEGARIKPKRIDTVFIADNFIWRKVREVNESGMDTIVPIQTETHTYLSPLGLSHNCVIIDDPQDVEDAQSETVTENDWNWFLSDVMFLGQNTRLFIIGNNLGERCIIERVMTNAKELNFDCHKVPIIVNGVSSWPSKYTVESIEKSKEDFRILGKLDIWFREKMCEAISDETRTFRREDFRYYTPSLINDLAKKCNIFICVDLAISEKQTADYTAIPVIGINSENHWFILDCVYGRFDPSQTIDHIFNLVKRWKPKMVGIERVAYQRALIHFIAKEMPVRDTFFAIKELEAEKQKEMRIKGIQPRFRTKTVWFPEHAQWLTEMESELLMFPKGLHDDLIDALAYLPTFGYPMDKSELKRQEYAGAGVVLQYAKDVNAEDLLKV